MKHKELLSPTESKRELLSKHVNRGFGHSGFSAVASKRVRQKILEALTYFRATFASDLRDKVYSLLGITTPYPTGPFPVSYSIS